MEGVKTFEVIGWSSGGPHALALAHAYTTLKSAGVSDSDNEHSGLPRLTRVTTVASDPPWGEVDWLTLFSTPHHAALFGAIKVVPTEVVARFVHAAVTTIQGLEVALDGLGFRLPDVLREVNLNFGEAMRQGIVGGRAVAEEMVRERGDWGFDLRGIEEKVRIVHSRGDR